MQVFSNEPLSTFVCRIKGAGGGVGDGAGVEVAVNDVFWCGFTSRDAVERKTKDKLVIISL